MEQYLTSEVKKGALYSAIVGTVIGFIGVIPVLNCLAAPVTCVVGFVLPIAIGWLVAQWSAATDMGRGAILGAFAAGIGGVISGVIVFVLNVLVNMVWSALGLGLGSDAGSTAVSIVAVVTGACIGFFIAAILSAIFGAVGGLLYVAIQGSKAKPA